MASGTASYDCGIPFPPMVGFAFLKVGFLLVPPPVVAPPQAPSPPRIVCILFLVSFKIFSS